jgi:thioredoxin 1
MVRALLFAMFAGLLVMSGCGCEKAKEAETTQDQKAVEESTSAASVVATIANAEDFEKNVEKATKPVVVKFSANWCGACKDIAQTYEELAKQKTDLAFCVVDIDAAKDLAQKFNINGVPTIVFFKDGKEVDPAKRHVGAASKEHLEKAINDAFGIEAAPAAEAAKPEEAKAEDAKAEQPESK